MCFHFAVLGDLFRFILLACWPRLLLVVPLSSLCLFRLTVGVQCLVCVSLVLCEILNLLLLADILERLFMEKRGAKG